YWTQINNNLPTVAVHEVAIHPTAGEIAVATHGRSIWILDVTTLRQMKKEVLEKSVHLFKPNTTTRWETLVTTGGTNRRFAGTNPTPGAHIYYWLADKAEKVSLKVMDVNGDVLFSYPTIAKDSKEGDEAGGKGGKEGKGG